MVRTLWLGAAAAVVLLGSGCNCNNTPFTDGDAGTGGGSSTGGGSTATGGSAATGGGTAATGGGTAATGGGTAATGGGTAATGGGTAATGGGTAATGGGTAATGGGTAATGGGTAAMGGGTAATGGGTAATGGGTAAMGGGTAAMGGGTAAMGGGSASDGGTTSCTGAATNTYVCQTCSGAADSNVGTSDCPVLTIGQGIANASALHMPTVFIASTSGTTTATYTEDLTVPDGVTLQGKWSVSGSAGAFTWARTAGRTAIVNLLPEGLRFAAAAGTAAGIDGLQITIVRPGSGVVAAAFGINVATASPTLIDFAVIGSTAAGTLPATEFGISVIGNGNTRSAPIIGSASIASAIGSIRATTQAEGLHIEKSVATVNNVDITEVAGGALSIGTRLVGAPGTTFTTGRSNALTGAACFGIFSTGDSSGVVFDGVNANGCGAGAVGASSQFSGGVVFDNCPAVTPGSAPPVYKNSTQVTGGAVTASPTGPAATPPLAVGVMATDGCSLQVTGNSSITGALAGSGATAAAYGVLCSFQGVTRMVGVDSPCTISTNTSIVGSNAAVVSSVGIACSGTCQSTDLACKGSCAQISDNKPGQQGGGVSAGSGTSQYALLVQESGPTVLRNSFAPVATSGTTTSCTNGWGALLVGAGGTYENNLFAGPDCNATNNPTAIGVQLSAEQRHDMNFASPLFHSNTILSFISSGISPIGSTAQAAVALIAVQGGGTQATIGSFYNNILQIGPLGVSTGNSSPSYVFEESSNKISPVIVDTNDFFVSGSTLSPPFFLQDGSMGLTTMSSVNAVPNVTSNVTLNPAFVSGSMPHISSTSAVKGQGTSTGGGPTDDYDGQARPNPVGTNPDIGADEVGG